MTTEELLAHTAVGFIIVIVLAFIIYRHTKPENEVVEEKPKRIYPYRIWMTEENFIDIDQWVLDALLKSMQENGPTRHICIKDRDGNFEVLINIQKIISIEKLEQ